MANDNPTSKDSKSAGQLTFTVRTVNAGGNYAPKHVFAIWIEDMNGFVKTRKAMANQRKQYLYTWKTASNYNVVDAITGSTLTSHQTHTVTWDCTDLDGNLVPDGDYQIWVEFTSQHAQGPLSTHTFTKGESPQNLTPPDETYFKDIEIIFDPLSANFEGDDTNICQNESVTFTDLSSGASSWSWNFGEGAEPATATTQGPHEVTYSTSGAKTVELTINGTLTETKEDYISVAVNPTAEFDFNGSDLTVNFINNSVNASTYTWDFGDANTSNENNPTHTYASGGNYLVNLTAQYFGCEDNVTHEVMVPITGINELANSNELSVYPNPNEGSFILYSPLDTPQKITILDQSGKVVSTMDNFNSYDSKVSIELQNLESGIYLLKAEFTKESKSIKLFIK
jgi:YD repeat-containing protein